MYKQLGVSSRDHVVEVQKGDLVAGYVNQTSMKTAKKIKEARGGILFVDEAYQLTQALQRGQSDFSGEAIDEMMKVSSLLCCSPMSPPVHGAALVSTYNRWLGCAKLQLLPKEKAFLGPAYKLFDLMIIDSWPRACAGNERDRTQGGNLHLCGVQEGDGRVCAVQCLSLIHI